MALIPLALAHVAQRWQATALIVLLFALAAAVAALTLALGEIRFGASVVSEALGRTSALALFAIAVLVQQTLQNQQIACCTGEIAMLRLLGARRVQVGAMVIVESAVRAVAGALAGLALAQVALASSPADVHALAAARSAGRAIPYEVIVVALALAAGAMAALWPAARAVRVDVAGSL